MENAEAKFKAYKELLIAKNRMRRHFFSLVMYGLSIWAILYWYDWKLLVIIFLWTWATNISNNTK